MNDCAGAAFYRSRCPDRWGNDCREDTNRYAAVWREPRAAMKERTHSSTKTRQITAIANWFATAMG